MIELCRSVGFTPTVYHGTVESIRAGVELVLQGRCLLCVPSSCIPALAGVTWKPLVEPASRYPWSMLRRSEDRSEHVQTVVACARALSRERGWLQTAGQTIG